MGDVVGQFGGPSGRSDAFGGEGVLDGDRDAGQWTEGPIRDAGIIDRRRFRSGPLRFERDHRVDRGVESFDAFEVVVEQFDRADLAGFQRGDQARERAGGVGHRQIRPARVGLRNRRSTSGQSVTDPPSGLDDCLGDRAR